ncbi:MULTISPECIES: ABC transporter ATP-binding protein [Rathayibacter]|uniref:ABC transporter ATP-binding protein n=1 Tax=Rathayibacter TaxID=33886 RepID=UPI0010645203|nr:MULTISPECIES: ABC transporter ATP-binding protein [Rathayibacter]MCJ1672197.1 ABC transporter ATP-binding protein/permease [Rathayibacter sp. VKM Ac-2929]MCJ1683582.1 ABC transporter ATP-binding protein/permease [Rathayibacter sp. VKM Ac-2928]MDY0914887.1 ABC transporter ATP-binding protein [Rathayibacter festucae]NQX16084.1 ABC transporter ATP-binding protein [Rathayibacter sp. VKM Ac-2857]TDX75924.1 ATP-binding cassette subfamily B protein [Rathayibacter sp. PhB151]
MSSTTESTRGGRRPRRGKDDGPRASFSQLVPYLLEHRGILSVVVVLSLFGAAASLAQPLVVGQVITRVQDGLDLGPLVWALLVLVVASGLISGFAHYLLQRTGEGIVLSSRRRLVARLLRLPIREFDARRTGDLVSRVGSDSTLLRAVLTQGLVDSIAGSLLFVGAIVAMAIIDWVLLLIIVVVVAVALGAALTLGRGIRVASRKAQEKVGDLAAAVERAISAVRTIRAAGATDREIAVVDTHATEAYRLGIRVAHISALVVPVAGIAMQVAFLAVLGVGGYRVASGAIDIAQLVSFILFLFMMVMPLGNFIGAITSVNSALGALGRIQEIIDLPIEGDGERDGGGLGPGVADSAIAFDDVVFSYDEKALDVDEDARDRTVLRGVSFTVPRGKRTALVGPSGAGKSTILALIERFYDPEAGVVRLGGVDITAIDRDALRAQIGYVEQDAPVLAGTLRENLVLGRPDASDEDCLRVLEAVNLTDVLERNPLGLNAPVGESGVMLSGGERQRLAIGRALLAAPPILLLDESTSSLDGLNEQRLRLAIDAVAENRTLLVIAHRLSTVVDSDQIVVLQKGEVVGIGTHSELVESTPLYRDLAKHQLLV